MYVNVKKILQNLSRYSIKTNVDESNTCPWPLCIGLRPPNAASEEAYAGAVDAAKEGDLARFDVKQLWPEDASRPI